jgi:adenylate cyclase
MHDPPRILIVDDNETNRSILAARLGAEGYETTEAENGERALAVARDAAPDVVLLDVMMPKIDGFEVCRRLKGDSALGFVPVIMVTARADSKDVVTGLNAGADEYLTKPLDHAALVARVRSMLRIKELHDRAEAQAVELASWNKMLEQRVAEQVEQIERVSRLKRFLSPQIAELILSSSTYEPLASHRRQVTIVFGDLRGFTAFAETAEPEEVMAVMREYHATLGSLIHEFEGTLERFVGDGIMVIFGDPIPCPDPCERAVQMAVAMRDRLSELSKK